MPIGLLLFAALLVVLTMRALFSGMIGVAGVCLGALFSIAVALRNHARSRASGLYGVAWRAVRVEAHALVNSGVLIAVVDPDQRPHLAALIAEAKDISEVLAVLAIDPTSSPPRTASWARREEDDGCGPAQDRGPLGALESATRVEGRPIALMRAFSSDPARTALEIARLIHPSHLVVLRAEHTSAEEQQRRATVVWESLKRPRPAVRVLMVSAGEEQTLAFDLDSAPAPRPGRAPR